MSIFKPGPPWPWHKRIVRKVCDALEWGDYEYLRFEFGRRPVKFFVTVYEPAARGSWHRRLFPWRLRCSLGSLLWSLTYYRCHICERGFTYAQTKNAVRYQSGTMLHQECVRRTRFRQFAP